MGVAEAVVQPAGIVVFGVLRGRRSSRYGAIQGKVTHSFDRMDLQSLYASKIMPGLQFLRLFTYF